MGTRTSASTSGPGRTVSATADGATLCLSGASLSASGSCTVTLNVTSVVVGGITSFILIGRVPTEQALSAVRMFHTCYAGARIVVIADRAAECRAFQEAGATVHLTEPVDYSLVFKVVEMLSLWVQTKRAARQPVLRLAASAAHS